MMFLNDRSEIAAAMNFGRYPVLTMNLENRPYEGHDFAIGCRVRVAWDHPNRRYEGMTTHGQLVMENGRLEITGEGACMSASFGYSDVMRMAAEANVPVVHAGQLVLVVLSLPSTSNVAVRVMRVGRLNMHCQTAAVLEDIESAEEIEEIRRGLREFVSR